MHIVINQCPPLLERVLRLNNTVRLLAPHVTENNFIYFLPQAYILPVPPGTSVKLSRHR